MKPKILVTGGAGYVGSVLVPYLLFEGYKVKVLDNLRFGVNGLFGCFNHPNFELVKADVREMAAVKEAAADIDIAIHLAALVGYPICKRYPDEAMGVNAGGTQIMASELPERIPIILSSTGSCYGNLEGMCEESSPLEPKTIYAESKAMAETTLQKRGNFVIYRFATGYGISPRMRLDLMINDFCYKAVKEKNLVVYERHFQRTFIHVTDMAKALLFAVENFDEMKDEVYNVGSEDLNLSKEDIAELIKEKVDYYLHYADFGHDEDQRNYEVSYEKINRVGWWKEMDLENAITQLIELFKVFEVKHEYGNV